MNDIAADTTNELVLFEQKFTPATLFKPGTIDPLIDHIRKEVTAELTDPTTAAAAERKRIAQEQHAEEEAAIKRELNKKHRAKINNEALTALVAEGIAEDAGKVAISAIAKGSVPHIKITY